MIDRDRLTLDQTPRDDVTRLGQWTEALAHGYDKATLVTTSGKAVKINRSVFNKMGCMLLAVGSKGKLSSSNAC